MQLDNVDVHENSVENVENNDGQLDRYIILRDDTVTVHVNNGHNEHVSETRSAHMTHNDDTGEAYEHDGIAHEKVALDDNDNGPLSETVDDDVHQMTSVIDDVYVIVNDYDGIHSIIHHDGDANIAENDDSEYIDDVTENVDALGDFFFIVDVVGSVLATRSNQRRGLSRGGSQRWAM